MNDNGMKALAKTLLTSGTAVILSYLINFFLTPYITDTVGTEAYGYVTLAKTMVNYVSVFTVGFTAFMVRYITLAYHRKDYRESCAYFSSSVGAVAVISVAVLIFAGVVIYFLDRWLIVPKDMLGSVRLMFLLVFVNFCLTTCAVPYSASCYIKNRLSVFNILKIASYFVESLILILFYRFFPTRIWYVGVGLAAASLTILAGNIAACRKLTPELVFDRQLASVNKVKTLVSNGIWQSINSLGNVLNSGLDLLITNQMLTGLAMGQLSIAKTIGSMFTVLMATISQAFQPRMMKAYSLGNRRLFLQELFFAMRITGFFSGCAFAGFYSLGILYYKLWLPNQNYTFIYYLTMITILASTVEGVIHPAYFVNTLTTKKKIPCLVTVGSGFINVIAMYILIKYYDIGVNAVVWTTAVLSFLINGIFNPVYCAITLSIPWFTLFPTILRHLCGCAMMCLLFQMVTLVMLPSSWLGLFLSATVCTAIGAPTYFFVVTNRQEREKLFTKLSKKVQQ